jgi:hypothetical protein
MFAKIINFFGEAIARFLDRKKIIALWVLTMGLSWFAACKYTHKPPPPVPEPVVVEWEIDEKYNDKRTKLPNGLTLSVFQDGEEGNMTWRWSVTGDAASEKEASERAFKMGGVK